MEEYMDEYGYYSDVNNILNSDEYKNMSIKYKNDILIRIITNNNETFERDNCENSNIEEYVLDDNFNNINNERIEEQSERKEILSNIDYSLLENTDIENIRQFLPRKDSLLFDKKISMIKCHLRVIIDDYDALINELDENDEEMLNYLLESRHDIEEKLEFVHSYSFKDEIHIEKNDNLKVVFFKYNGSNLLLEDILSEDVEKYPSYLVLINSIKDKNKSFKDPKVISKGEYNLRVYEVRNNSQRVIFDFLSPNTIIIIQAFSKKVVTDKKYRLNLENRLVKYLEMKKILKEQVQNNYLEFISDSNLDDTILMELLETKNKSLVKRGK